jgi:hypothetical protein
MKYRTKQDSQTLYSIQLAIAVVLLGYDLVAGHSVSQMFGTAIGYLICMWFWSWWELPYQTFIEEFMVWTVNNTDRIIEIIQQHLGPTNANAKEQVERSGRVEPDGEAE